MARQPVLFYVLIIVILILSSTLHAQTRIQTTQKTIVLDAGHGGQDSGLVSSFGVTEKLTTLELIKRIALKLSSRYNVILTRSEDKTLSPEQRVSIANQVRADLYLSVHLSNARDNMVFGYYFAHPDPEFTRPGNGETRWRMAGLLHQKQSKAAGEAFSTIFLNQNPPISFHLLGAPIRLLEGATMPALMIEAAPVLSVPQQSIAQDAFLSNSAGLIADSIQLYFNKNQTPP